MLIVAFIVVAVIAFWLGRTVERGLNDDGARVRRSVAKASTRIGYETAPKSTPAHRDETHHLYVYRPPVKALLEYRDFNGDKSLRQVDVHQSLRKDDGTIYLKGFCHLRNEERTFRADGIVSVASLDGEVLDTRTWLSNDLHIQLWARGLRAMRQQQ